MLSDMEMKGPAIYDLYEGREDVELAFDAMKSTIDAGRTWRPPNTLGTLQVSPPSVEEATSGSRRSRG